MEGAKRRETRRRKLLETSEDRFKRIERLKNRSQEAEEEDSGHIVSSGQASVDDPVSKSIHVALLSEPIEEERALLSQLRYNKDDSQSQRAETSRVPGGASQHNPIPPDISQDSGFVDGPLTSQNETQSCEKKKPQHGRKAVVSVQTFVFSLLAVVTRLWLVNMLQSQFIMVLFFATEVLLFSIRLKESPVQSGPVRFITALLTFRGVSPKTIHRVQHCLGFCQGTISDFSAFLFMFVMMHVILQGPSTLGEPEPVP